MRGRQCYTRPAATAGDDSGSTAPGGRTRTPADLGIAMGTGTDIAMSAADITLVRADLTAAGDAVRLSRRTVRA
jgi:Cu+-exporting ATPase